MKIAAAALAVLMFFLSGYSAGLFLKGYFLFNGYDEDCDFTQTNSFRTLLNSCESTLLADAELMSCENEDDFLKTSLGKNYSQNIQNVNDAFDLLESSGVKVYVTEDNRYRYSYDLGGTTYYFSYNGDVISRDEFDRYDFVGDGIEYTDAVEATEPAAEDVDSTSVTKPVPAKSGNPKPIDDIRDALALLNSFGGYTCYGEISREDLIKTIRKSEMQHSGVYEVDGKIAFYDTAIPSTSELKYTILVKSTGKVVSNCGIDSDIGFDNVYEAMREGAALVEGNNGKFVTTAETSEATRGGLLSEWAEELFYQKPTVSEHRSIGDDVSYAVFTYTPTDENSFFTLKELEFENYKSHFITNPTTNLIISVFSFLLACAACVYLLCVAGKTADGETKLCPTDRIPLLINTAIIGGIITLIILGFAAIFDAEYEFYPSVGESSEWFLRISRRCVRRRIRAAYRFDGEHSPQHALPHLHAPHADILDSQALCLHRQKDTQKGKIHLRLRLHGRQRQEVQAPCNYSDSDVFPHKFSCDSSLPHFKQRRSARHHPADNALGHPLYRFA